MITYHRWQRLVLVVIYALGMTGARVIGAQDQAPRFLFATRSGLVPLDIARTPLLMRRVSPTMQGVPLSEALATIGAESGVPFVFTIRDLPAGRRVRLKAEDITVAAALMEILLGTGMDVVFSREGNIVLVKRTSIAYAGQVLRTGIVRGRVIDQNTRAPVVAATVTVVGAKLSRYTDEQGAYLIPGVPVGEFTVAVRRLGFEPLSQHVHIGEGETVTADFAIHRAATTLTEVVTTATGERSRLEVGNAIGTIKADSVVPATLIRNFSDLLTARTPGVVVQNVGGYVGQPSRIRIRGESSIQLNNDPIVIVDGVRLLSQISNDNDQMNVGSAFIKTQPSSLGLQTTIAQAAPSRLDDIDPNTIESIDILRGPSAATLYGTEAAKGVIVIKTKKGAAGPFRFSLLADDGWSTLPGAFPSIYYAWGHSITGGIIDPKADAGNSGTGSCWIGGGGAAGRNYADGTCILDSVVSFNPANNPEMSTLGTGTARNVSGSMSGGTEQLKEFLSLRGSENIGMARLSPVEERRVTRMWGETPPSWMLHPNTEDILNGSSRTNFHAAAHLDLALSVNGIYRDVLNGSAALLRGNTSANAFGSTGPGDTLLYLPAEALRPKLETVAKRGFASVTGNYTPLGWLAFHGALGGDYTLRSDDALLRPTDCTLQLAPSTGCSSDHANDRGEVFVTTLDVGAQATITPWPWLTSRTAIGEQANKTTFYELSASNNGGSTNLAFGSTLLTPAPVVLSGTPQQYVVSESRDANATAGWYLEQTAAIRERLFLTAAFREDAASAFGPAVNAKLPVYPKFSASWLLSDEAFFPWKSVVSSFRLRTAYGHSGTQARQNDVLANFTQGSVLDPTGATVAGLSLSQVANPILRPERTVEWEGGFDASMGESERLHVEATLYRKITEDAIVSAALPPSYGTSAIGSKNLRQVQNLGQVENRGVELMLTVKMVEARAFAWDLTVNMTQNANRLVHLIPGAQSPASLPFSVVREGYPLFGYWGKQVVSYADANGDGVLNVNTEVAYTDANVFFGAPYPQREVTWINGFTLLNGAVRVNATVDQIVGLSTQLNSIASLSGGLQIMSDPSVSLAQQAEGLQCGMNSFSCFDRSSSVRFSELSITYALSRTLAHRLLRSQSASFTFAGRNLGLWTNYNGKDPNVNNDISNPFQQGATEVTVDGLFGSIPQPRNWTLRFNLGY